MIDVKPSKSDGCILLNFNVFPKSVPNLSKIWHYDFGEQLYSENLILCAFNSCLWLLDEVGLSTMGVDILHELYGARQELPSRALHFKPNFKLCDELYRLMYLSSSIILLL